MGRRRAHAPLTILINGREVGRLEKAADGAVFFQYARDWVEWPQAFPISLSLPLQQAAYRGEAVNAVFDNLLPDSPAVRRQVARTTGARGADTYSLLQEIGRDCVGAMQFLPDGLEVDVSGAIQAEPIGEDEIERLLANLAHAPLGVDPEEGFRISIAGAQEKTALLFHDGRWKRPIGATPTTHILKPQLGRIPTASGEVDLTHSVDNEHYCLALMRAFGLETAKTEIATFGERRVLVVERFDRAWRSDGRLLRLPQEDLCQALSIPSSRKYQDHGGPGMRNILDRLQEADDPARDRLAFFSSQILFWLTGATDGHAKNFSLFLRPGGRFELTPFYDVLTAQPAFDAKQIPHNSFRLAMSAGASPHYRVDDVLGRHFIQSGKVAGLGPTAMRKVVDEIRAHAETAPDRALTDMPDDFHPEAYDAIKAVLPRRLKLLETAYDLL
ncbi:type II toxin-antitoxin system HipA family toxin [Brevundimonas sp. SORGH_AS_0993]|uniref:type II toxin-antitoxin system HipA family toxin n=1 Tax=Brevundimonas sp. SORGH_AS_0993 TaxID=3041794 RepID=UPI002783175D|nr:type II toxin-antitoxin system HipA family toxin [Brevundimonas sp. SORGH_AS_0993]MDQ1155190.1 serine/threonine-protein kinase HipA [Brevundimonas sp. SORGH_AS_0993]